MPPGWPQLRLRVLARDRWRCRRCGGFAWIADHIVRGGPDTEANLQALCGGCSGAKTQREAAAARNARRSSGR